MARNHYVAGAVLWLIAIFPVTAVSGQEAFSTHRHPYIGPHGGIVEDIASYNAELLVRGMDMSLFLTDHNDRPVESRGFKANVVVTTGSVRRGTFALSPDGNKLVGRGPHPDAGNLRAIVTLMTANGTAGRAGYELH